MGLAQKDIKNHIEQLNVLRDRLIKNKPEELNGTNLIEQYPFLFINDSKKDILLKNKLAGELAKMLPSGGTENKKEPVNTVVLDTTIDAFKKAPKETLQEAISIVKTYAELSFLSDIQTPKNQARYPFFDILAKLGVPTIQNNTSILPLSQIFLAF